MKKLLRPIYFSLTNPSLAKPIFYDLFGKKGKIKDNALHLKKAAEWILQSQKVNPDGGSASHLDRTGWLPSFPETTGYIIPSMLKYCKYSGDTLYRESAIKMGEFLLKQQLENGAYQGGNLSAEKKVPTIFNTGQIIFGLCALFEETKDERFLNAATKAGDWMCSVQDNDGCWRKGLSPYADQIPHPYNVRAAWALLELNKINPKSDYVLSNEKNVNWTLSQKNDNHWFINNAFVKGNPPFTHTIAYTLRGILESGIVTNNDHWIQEVKKSVDQLTIVMRSNGTFGSRLDDKWNSQDHSSCLTGNLQLSIIYGKLYELFNEKKYLENLKRINAFHKSTQFTKGSVNTTGAIKGSHPFWGAYCPYSYPNWATKFFIDALLLEEEIVASD
ncbi:MAG: terpene cyclase/mutase family protein [Crocinitomicaceae bacterium]|nr:terpene cyclase/mutase family protein [Crocinitomicaceae bacterium]